MSPACGPGNMTRIREKPFGREKLDELRKLFFEGKLIEGNGIAGRECHCILRHPSGKIKLFDYTGKEGRREDYRRVGPDECRGDGFF